MAVTRSTSAKKVVNKAVAVKVTNSSGGKYVSWDDRYNQLFALSEKEGHCRPHSSTTLGKRCNQQRSNYNDNNRVLYQYQIDKLVEIDFQFCLYNKTPKKRLAWIDRYNDLVDYKNEHGHASPPVSEGQLGRWCKSQCRIFQDRFRSTGKATMFQYQIDKLVEIDFQFNLQPGKRDWNDHYNDLVDYKNEHGHANPPTREGQLGAWCRNQRYILQNNKFSSTEKNATMVQYWINKLVEIGFQFKLQPGKCTLQRANLLARPDLQPYRKCLLCQTCRLCHPWRSCQIVYIAYLMSLLFNKKGNWDELGAWCLKLLCKLCESTLVYRLGVESNLPSKTPITPSPSLKCQVCVI